MEQNEAKESCSGRAKALVVEKITLLEARLKSIDDFINLSVTEFIERLPGFERLMPLLAQSITDVCHTLVRHHADSAPRSLVDIVSACEKYGLFPAPFVRSLAQQLVVIDNGYERIDANDLLQIQKDLPETTRVFREFITRSRDLACEMHSC